MDAYSPLINQIYSAIQMHYPSGTHQQNERPLLEILDCATVGACAVDLASGRVEFSEQWLDRLNMRHCCEKEQLRMTIDAIHPDDKERVLTYFHGGVTAGFPPNGIEFRLNTFNGDCIWVFSKGRAVRDERGVPVKYYNTCFDITDRKNFESQLNENTRILTNFFKNISHEFRTPLSIMLLYVDMMDVHVSQAQCSFRDKIDSNTAVLRQNAYRLLRLTSNLLDITTMDAGHLGVRLEVCDIVGKAREVAEAVAAHSARHGIRIGFSSDSGSRMIPMDCEKLERIMLNLLSNAIKHTPRGGSISVSVENAADSATVCVRDSGEGIPSDRRDSLFRLFSQVNSSLTRTNEGIGVGLALTRGLVGLLGGAIWFESAPGEGCAFYVRFPVLPAKECSNHPDLNSIPLNRRIEMEFSDIAYE